MPALRSALVLLAVLAAGMLLGHLLGGAPDPGLPEEPSDGRPVSARQGETEPRLAGRARAEGDPAPVAPGTDTSRSESTPSGTAPITPPDEPPLLEVHVSDADGNLAFATVYAFLRDGAQGAESDGLTGDHYPPASCRLRLPVAGTYDVYARSNHPYGVARRLGVLARAGEVVPVNLVFAAGRPIHVVLGEPWPLGDQLAAGRLEGQIWIHSARGEPGQEDPLGGMPRLHQSLPLSPSTGPWKSSPLPPELTYEVTVSLGVAEAHRGGSSTSPDYGVFATPGVVRAGDTVRLHAERLVNLHVRPRLESPEAWPEGAVRLDLTFEGGRGVHTRTQRWRGADRIRKQKWPLIFCGRPGKARLTWDGPGIASGSLENLELDPTRPLEVEMLLRLDAKELPSQEPLVVRVTGSDGQPLDLSGEELAVAALVDSDDEDRPEVLEWWGDDPADRPELNYGWRRAQSLVVYQGTRWVGRPTPIPPRGGMTATLEAAGMVVVVPRRFLGEGEGTLRIRRTDGQPFLLFGDRDHPVLRRSTYVYPGDLLGPLPAGRHVFQVELAGRRLSDVAVDVKPGEVSVLRLTW